MSTAEIRDYNTDNYIVLSQYDASSNLEVAIAQALVQSAYQKITIEPSDPTYISPANDSSWNLVSMNSVYPDYINTSAISNYPSGTLPEYSVISSELTTDISLNSYTTNISSGLCANNTYTFQSLPTTSSYYDSNYVFTQNLIADCSDNQTGTYVNATFDTNASNAKIQYAMQSRWNTTLGPYTGLQTVGPDPTAITQDDNFNTNIAFAQYGSGATDASYESYWFSVNASNGILNPTSIDASYQPILNNLLVANRDMNGVTLNVNDDVGIFRIQQASNTPATIVSLNDSSFNTITNNDLDHMPLFDGNGQNPLVYNSSKNSLPIPGTMSAIQFESLFNEEVYNTVADDWTFQIDVSSNNNSGYNINVSHPLISDLDNSNLLDNPFYMQNYVSNAHSITFSNASISIVEGVDGTSVDANSITIDLSNGETLPQVYAGVDGQIIINTNTIYTRYTELSNVDLSGNFTPLVAYSGDLSSNTLSYDEMTNPYFKGMWQKVAQQSSVTSPDYWLKTDASAIMTLYTEDVGIVDNLYNASDFDFSFNNTFGASTDIQLWKISGSNNIIINPDSFYIDASYTIQEIGIATAGLITGITDFNDFNYNGYRVLLTAKTKEQIGLYNAVTDVSGWTLSYSGGILDSFLHSSANQAYSKNSLPIYDQSVISALDGGANLDFSYTYKTIVDASSAGGLVDYVDISYNSNVVTIDQTLITRNYDASYANVSISVVPDASYSFTSVAFNKDSFELVYVDANSRYNASFFANYGPFTNIRLTVSNILQNDIFYAVRNKSSGKLSPHSVLSYVSAPDISNLNDIDETITPSPGNSLSINGTFTANDLKPFYSITQGENTNFTWTTIGESIDTDVYYGLENDESVLTTATLKTTIQYTPFSNSVNQSILVNLDLLNYYIPFVYDQSNNAFSLQYFTSSPSTLAANTTIGSSSSFLGNTDYLRLTNGYDNVTWLNNQYTLTLTHTATTITFTAKDLANVTQFTITLLNNTLFLGTFFVSYIPEDYYRAERLLGQDENTNTYTESFLSTSYGGRVNLTTTLEGVYIGSTTLALSPTTCPQLGSYQSFRVLGDYMNINEVGTTTPPTPNNELGTTSYNSGSLTFQYLSGSNYSAAFTFPKYRGYQSFFDAPNQYYLIDRDATSVTFDVAGPTPAQALSDTLTSNMYYNEPFNVDNLQRESDSVLVANLGVTGYFNYSIPPTSSTLTYPVTVIGDNVAVSINNPNYLGDASNVSVPGDATPVVDPKFYSDSMTLKDYGQNDMYTFSGNWYVTTRLMAIRPSRVKLNNTAYSYDNLSYKINLIAQSTRLYKAVNISSDISFNWLGNPSIKGTQDPETTPSTSDWVLKQIYSSQEFNNGVIIGKKVIYQNPLLSSNLKIVYIVSTPPYYYFEQTSTASCPVIPYNASSQYLANQTFISMPYISTSNGSLSNIFNPFAPSTTYTDISGNNTSVQNNADFLNNVTFDLLSAPSITDATIAPDSTRYGIIVPGTNLTVSLYTGLYNNTNTGNHINPIWTGPVTSIPSTPDITNNALIFRGRDASGSISFSALQYPADIGYPDGAVGYEEIFKSDVSSNWYNIDFNMGNSGWFNNNTQITYFNTDAHGIKPTLYTVVDINNNPYSQINKRRVYKYTTPSTIDIDLSSGLLSGYETFNMTFESRYYHDFDISKNNVFPDASGSIWKYNDLLDNTVIPDTSISWTLDASYSDTVYISWAFGNSTTAKNMLIQLFGVQNNQQKWAYIQLEPFMRYLNQFNMQVGSVAWDGTVTAPLVNTRVIKLAPSLTNPILLNNTYATQEYSESTL
jgi:hypothetical protein